MPSRNLRWQQSPDALWRRTIDGVVLASPRVGGAPIVVTGPGGYLWDLLAEPCDERSLFETLASTYRCEVETVAADLTSILDELETVGTRRCESWEELPRSRIEPDRLWVGRDR